MSMAIAHLTATMAMPAQAETDSQVIALWLNSHTSPHTRRAYSADITRLLTVTGTSLAGITVGHLQAFAAGLAGLSKATQKRAINAVKSLLSFAERIGYLAYNVGSVVKAPKPKDGLAERILTEAEVFAMLAHTSGRDNLLLRLLYASAARVSELVALQWRDVTPNGESGQVTLYGKGEETRRVLLSPATWQALQAMRPIDAAPDSPVFVSQKGGHLDASQVHRIVRAAARRAGIQGNVSPHWFRHSHASHALDRGASVALVRDTLGHASIATTSKYLHARPNDSSALHLAI